MDKEENGGIRWEYSGWDGSLSPFFGIVFPLHSPDITSGYIFCRFFAIIIQKIIFRVFFRAKKGILSRNSFNKNPSAFWTLIYFF